MRKEFEDWWKAPGYTQDDSYIDKHAASDCFDAGVEQGRNEARAIIAALVRENPLKEIDVLDPRDAAWVAACEWLAKNGGGV